MIAPRDAVADAGQPGPEGAGQEWFAGFGVMGLPFSSGHVLGLRCWSRSSVGPPYTSVWHRAPDGRWSFWSTAPAEVSCTRYTGELSDDTRQTDIDLRWPAADRLCVRSADPELTWDLTFRTTTTSRVLSAMSSRLPSWVTTRRGVLRVMGPTAGLVLGAGRLAMTGHMPNGQQFRLVPSAIWPVAASTAVLAGEDLGVPEPLAHQATIGDFRIPQRGLLAVGVVDFDRFEATRHSSHVQRPSRP